MGYRIGIDVGGTFTDFLLINSIGNSKIYKTLTTPANPTIGLFNGMKNMADDINLSVYDFLQQVDIIVHGTTVGTNAALTYRGAKTGLITTEGFRDILEMRRGVRPDAYNNRYQNPKPYVERKNRLTLKERIDYSGKVVQDLVLDQVEEVLEKFKKEDIQSIAVSFMHSYANNQHEKEVGEYIRKKYPEFYLTLSSELVPRANLYERTSTTVLNSFVGPIIENYFSLLVNRLEEEAFKGVLLIMQSNGGVSTPQEVIQKAANTLLSGPASAPIAASWYLKPHNMLDAITMDMGGTSFDVSILKDGNPLVRSEGEIAGWPINLPIVDIYTIGSGGGSIAWVDEGGLLHVGPQSAGANPGPACYGFGGELPTVTDANLILGYLDPEFFLGGKMKLDRDKAYQAIKENISEKLNLTVEQAAKGIIDMINVNMSNGIRQATINQGYDPREFPLISAGGAGPLHAVEIAKELECELVIVPRASSIFCAAGMLMSDIRHDFVKSKRALTSVITVKEIKDIFTDLKLEGIKVLIAENVKEEEIEFQYHFDMMYADQYYQVPIRFKESEVGDLSIEEIEKRFHQIHDQLFGYNTDTMPVEIVNFNVTAVGKTVKPMMNTKPYHSSSANHTLKGSRDIYLNNSKGYQRVNVYDGDQLNHGNTFTGPALIEQVVSTIVIPEEFNCIVDKNDNFILYKKNLAENQIKLFVTLEQEVVL